MGGWQRSARFDPLRYPSDSPDDAGGRIQEPARGKRQKRKKISCSRGIVRTERGIFRAAVGDTAQTKTEQIRKRAGKMDQIRTER